MNNTLRSISLVSALFCSTLLSAQSDWCGSDRYLKQRIASDPQAAQKWEDFKTAHAHQTGNNASRAASETVYIPIVFHIVHDGDAIGVSENISDAQALSQIDALNLYYNYQDPGIANVPGAFQSLVGNCNVRFCIAKFDENGNPTTGIIRHQFPNASWDTDGDVENTLKPATIWDPTRYLNIWSIKMGGQFLLDGILAYSSFPGFGDPDADGIAARYTNIGTTNSVPQSYRKGKTITHEIGHWLGLVHTWGFDASCADFGDFITDTPDQADMNFGCPTFPHVTCSNGPNGDMFMNYMDYTNDACQVMFTIGQAVRMHETLDGTRANIKSATSGCFFNLDAAVVKLVLPSDTVCSLSFKPVVTIRNQGTTTITSGKIYFQIDAAGTQIVNWSGSLATQQEMQITLPAQTVTGGTHTIDVTFGNVNGQSSDGFSGNDNKNTSFFAYDGGLPSPLALSEDFELVYPPLNWSGYNPNFDVTWAQNLNFGAYGLSYSCVSINNLSYTSNPGSRKDAFITETYDFTAMAYPELKFDVAYARNTPLRSDSLNLYYSLDCGSNWIKIWNQSGSELKTAPDQTTLFIPDPSQWKTVSVPLTSIAEQGNVSFKFENVTDWGNAMYIDNINIRNNPALTLNEIQKQDIKVFPNPAGSLVAVRLPVNHSFQTLQLINSIGEVVYETAVSDNAVIFPVENFTNGLYLIHLKGNTSSQTEKLLISK